MMGLKNPKLLLLGLVRFILAVVITIVSASFILVYHQEILNLMWPKPAGGWLIWLWHIISWLLSAVLVGLSAVLSYLVSQILFSVLIMDLMSRITEQSVTGTVQQPTKIPIWRQFLFLIRQEIPRTTVPVLLTLLLIFVGWLSPLGPVVTVASTAIAVIFLAWDNTDLIPARRLMPFGDRFRILRRTLPFHLGFGLLFLIPFLNLLFLSFAPVGATLYYIDKNKA